MPARSDIRYIRRKEIPALIRLRLLPIPAHLNIVIRLVMGVVLAVAPAAAAAPAVCVGVSSLGTFEILVRPFSSGSPLPLKSVAAVPAGSRLIWNPVHLAPPAFRNGEVAAVLVPASE